MPTGCGMALHAACQPQLVAMAVWRSALHPLHAELAALYVIGTEPVRRKHATAHNGNTVQWHRCVLSHSHAVVCWLTVVIYWPSRESDSVRSAG